MSALNKTGLSTAFLSRRVFGKNGSSIFSALLAISSITWISLNGDIFSRLIKSTFQWWPVSVPITAIIIILIWTQLAIGVAVCAAIFAALGIYKYMVPITTYLALLIPPVPGLLVAEEFFIKKSKEHMNTNIIAIIAWIFGGIASYICLKSNFFIPPLIGMLTSGILYYVFSKAAERKVVVGNKVDLK
ncbi:hypothetical protein [Clostridium sp. DJ247]|uniref:hypothetical protein n=1 Tax=Clostridium sp. DJ247 TaxID=2726188 RepID=UPI001625C8EE|nr:hypothetical protein [Clostridium sp. DJ247]MBC2581980.1 hypothetical protein [Clostridium sp. DJ247]